MAFDNKFITILSIALGSAATIHSSTLVSNTICIFLHCEYFSIESTIFSTTHTISIFFLFNS